MVRAGFSFFGQVVGRHNAPMDFDAPPPDELLDRDGRPVAVRPDFRFLLAHPAHALALGFGAGLAPLAPGTVGTLWAWASFALLAPHLTDGLWATLLFGGLLVGTWACKVSATHLGTADPGCVVWDEVLAFWLVLWVLGPSAWTTQALAFVLFRFFDAAKPGPVGWADAAFKGFGWRGAFGIMFDDLVAASCTLLVFAVWRAW